MGRVRTHDIKKVSRELLERYPEKLGTDFNENKLVVSEVKVAGSKRIRNKIAGYIATLAKRRPGL